MLKKSVVSLLAALCLTLLLSGVAMAKEIIVINGTDFNLTGMAMSPSATSEWGEDFLASDVLRPGEGLRITINASNIAWDLGVVDDEGVQLNFEGLDLSRVSKITLHSDGTADLE